MNVIAAVSAGKVEDGSNILITRPIHPWTTESRRQPLHRVLVTVYGTNVLLQADEGTFILPTAEIVEVFE